MPEPEPVKSSLFDIAELNDAAMDQLASIFRTIRWSTSKATRDQSNLLLLMDKSLSPRVNALTPFANFRKVTGISRVMWYDPDDHDKLDYETLSKQYSEFVIMVNLISMDDLLQLSEFLKQRMHIFNNSSIAVSLVLVDTDKQRSTKLVLESLGVWGDIQGVYHWPLASFCTLEDDIVTLDLPNGGMNALYQSASIEPVEQLAHALLQMVIKSNYKIRITNLYLKGDLSVVFWKVYQKLWGQHLAQLSPSDRKTIEDQDDTLFSDQYSFFNRNVDFVCLDRGVDLIGSLLTELTYTGLSDELLGVKLGLLSFNENSHVDREGVNDSGERQPDQISIPVKDTTQVKFGDPSDEVYPLIRDLNFSLVGGVLNTKARQLQAEFDRRNSLQNIDEMKKFVGELNHLKEVQGQVQKHTSVAEQIMKLTNPALPTTKSDSIFGDDVDAPIYDYYQEFIGLQQDLLADSFDSKKSCTKIVELMFKYEPPFDHIIRLLFILSIVKKGIREQEYETAKTAILNAYGVTYLPTLMKLRELKFIYPREQQLNFLASTAADSQDYGKYQLIKDFKSLSYHLNLLPATDTDAQNPVDADFALPGYVPIVSRLVEAIYYRDFLQVDAAERLRNVRHPRNDIVRYKKYGWDNLDLSELNGEVHQDLLVPDSKRALFSSIVPPKMSKLNSYYSQRRDMLIVSVLGGITYSEIAAIRYVLSKSEVTRGKQLIILTTGIIRAADVVNALV